MFEYFKLLELYEGKITLDVSDITPSEAAILAEFKIELNKKMMEEQEKVRRNSTSGNSRAVDINDLEYKQKLFGHVKRRG